MYIYINETIMADRTMKDSTDVSDLSTAFTYYLNHYF